MTSGQSGIGVLWGEPKEARSLARLLSATGEEVHQLTELKFENVIELRLLVVDYDKHRDQAVELLRTMSSGRRERPSVLVVSASRSEADLLDLLGQDAFANLLAKTGGGTIGTNHLLVTAQKLLRRDVFGLEKYLGWSASRTSVQVRSSNEKPELLDRVEAYLQRIGCAERLISLAKTVTDEFLTNALYNAPADQEGKPRFASFSRDRVVELGAEEAVTLEYSFDGTVFGLAVQDRFGRLRRETVKSYIRKGLARGADQIDTKDGGAGLGMLQIFQSLNHLIVNIAPTKRTEMIGLIDVSGTYRNFVEQSKSLTIFVEEE